MKFNSMRRRLDALEPPPSDLGGPHCSLWPDARQAIFAVVDDNRDAARALLDALKSDRQQDRSCPELIDFVLATLEPFPSARASVAIALDDICPCRDHQ